MKKRSPAAFSIALSLLLPLLAKTQTLGPRGLPAEMSIDYNPLLWRGDDAQFALDMIYGSRCNTELSNVVLARSSDPQIQALATSVAMDDHKMNRRLRSMARTFNFHVPKPDPDTCREASRFAELTGPELDKQYVAMMTARQTAAVTRFETVAAEPMNPSNYSLRKFAAKTLPALRQNAAALTAEHKKLTAK